MPANTPLGISYPLYADPVSGTQAYFQDMATDMDGLVEQLDNRLDAAAQRPCVRISGLANQLIAPNLDTTVTFSAEDFDRGNMADIAVNNTRIQLVERGMYIVGAMVNFAPTSGTWGATVQLIGSAGLGGGLISGRGSSSTLDGSTTPTYLNPVALWFADGVTTVNITAIVRQNSIGGINISNRFLYAAKVSNTQGGF